LVVSIDFVDVGDDMLILDPVGDLLTRIRNGQKAKKPSVSAPASKEREAVLRVLVSEGYISNYTKVKNQRGFDELQVKLKYVNGHGSIRSITRVSKPGRRVYSSVRDLVPVCNGLGINILSTPRGVMSDVEARKAFVGGEVICKVF
jgi:small subunit ribosomal protein S8